MFPYTETILHFITQNSYCAPTETIKMAHVLLSLQLILLLIVTTIPICTSDWEDT
jgi:hypothetical protein